MKIPKHYDRCATCDEWWNTHDPESAKVHLHPEPQSGAPRDHWLASRLPYERWIVETDEGKAWELSKHSVKETIRPKSTLYHSVPHTLSYEEIRNAIETLPQTWCPSLLVAIVGACVRNNVFVEGGLENVVARALHEAKEAQKIPK